MTKRDRLKEIEDHSNYIQIHFVFTKFIRFEFHSEFYRQECIQDHQGYQMVHSKFREISPILFLLRE